jgi:hypothetical protein
MRRLDWPARDTLAKFRIQEPSALSRRDLLRPARVKWWRSCKHEAGSVARVPPMEIERRVAEAAPTPFPKRVVSIKPDYEAILEARAIAGVQPIFPLRASLL